LFLFFLPVIFYDAGEGGDNDAGDVSGAPPGADC